MTAEDRPDRRRLGGAVVLAVFAYALALAVNRSLRDVTGRSMLPTVRPGDRLLVVPTWLRAPRPGDLVVVRDPREPSRRTVKRLAGGPGDRVRVQMPAPIVWRLRDDQYAVLGDNRDASTDSRTYGPVGADAIEAVVVWRVRPFGPVTPRPTAPSPGPGPRRPTPRTAASPPTGRSPRDDG